MRRRASDALPTSRSCQTPAATLREIVKPMRAVLRGWPRTSVRHAPPANRLVMGARNWLRIAPSKVSPPSALKEGTRRVTAWVLLRP